MILTRRAALVACGLLGAARGADALMAGTAPDSPAARVDANTDRSPWGGVVAVLAGGSTFSGIAIAPNYVLTAAHVAAGAQPSALQVVVNGAVPVTLAVAFVAGYPGAVFPYDDLALLRLAQPLPAGTPTYPIVDAAQPIGAALSMVGYGSSGAGDLGVSVNAAPNVKRFGRNVLDRLTARIDGSGRAGAFFLYDFDGPTGNGALGGPTLGNTTETAVAAGDSGAGAFIDAGNGPALYGLLTVALNFSGAAASMFGSGGGGQVLSHPAYLAWLRSQTGDTLTLLSQVSSTDVPAAPGWALAALGLGLSARLLRVRRSAP